MGDRRALGIAVAVAGLVAAAVAIQAQQASPPSSPAGDRVAALLAAMTLDEKLSLLHGAPDPTGTSGAGYVPGVPRLGIPPLRLSDGPAGIRTKQKATALPAPVALAATFDPGLAQRYGEVLGRELRARGQDVLLAPMVNIVRVPTGGRNFETLGEDPCLASRIVEAEVRGIQAQHAIATIKHFAENNQEDQRTTVDVRVDERTLREIELQPFEAAIRAGAGAVMASYNKVNGTYASENPMLLTDILRGDWHFDGFTMSDWGATHSGAPALRAGLDMEMPSNLQYASLSVALRNGQVSAGLVDTAVRRILTQMDRAGLLGGAAPPRPALDADADARVARDVAAAGAVLLRNESHALPLGAGDLASMAVIGPTAKLPLIGGGGSARVEPMRVTSALAALRTRAGANARIDYEAGIDLDGVAIPITVLGTLPIDATGDRALPAGSMRTWTGLLNVPADGDYELKLQADRGRATLSIDGDTLVGQRAPGAAGAAFGPTFNGVFGGVFRTSLLDTADGLQNASVTKKLTAGPHPFLVTTAAPMDQPQQVRLAWVTPAMRQAHLDAAVAAARRARTAVVFAYNEGTEGRDRGSLTLPANQNALIDAVAAANPRTIVVLNTGDPVTMPWVERVPAILQTWYAGQEGADATAALLAGDVSPSGKLPVTFPRRPEDSPVRQADRYPGLNGREVYSEGVFVGYRWYDDHALAPLFPFGHGLSYTTFAYSDLTTQPRGDGIEVTFTVRNTGDRAGAEVAQVYVGRPARPPVAMPPQALAAFARVALAPGERRTVTLLIDPRALSYWSVVTHAWTPVHDRPVLVGASSRDIRLRGSL